MIINVDQIWTNTIVLRVPVAFTKKDVEHAVDWPTLREHLLNSARESLAQAIDEAVKQQGWRQ